MTLAEWLTREMAERKLGDRQLAKDVHVSHTTIRQWKKGYTTPTYENCEALARALQADVKAVRRLAGRERPDTSPDDLTFDERELLHWFRESDRRGKDWIRRAALAAFETRGG